jgi:hypothetical protein
VKLEDGRVFAFNSPDAHEQMQGLSDRIRAIPDEIASVDGAMKATRPSNVIPFE